MSSYNTTVRIKASTKTVFNAISKKLEDWWGPQNKPIDQEGIIFRVQWGEPWYEFEVKRYVEREMMAWKCVDANQKIPGLDGVEKEWVGTEIHWRLIPLRKNLTLLEFEHKGLVPAFICFDFCSASWDHFLKDSLVKNLEGN